MIKPDLVIKLKFYPNLKLLTIMMTVLLGRLFFVFLFFIEETQVGEEMKIYFSVVWPFL